MIMIMQAVWFEWIVYDHMHECNNLTQLMG